MQVNVYEKKMNKVKNLGLHNIDWDRWRVCKWFKFPKRESNKLHEPYDILENIGERKEILKQDDLGAGEIWE